MEWKAAWRYRQIDYGTVIGTIENITQRTILKNNLNGEQIRIQFSNRYSNERLVLERVIVAKKMKDKEDILQPVAITYNGSERIELAPNEEFYSDAIQWGIQAGEDIIISAYIKEKINVQSSCSTWSAKSWNTMYGLGGDYTLEQHIDGKGSEEIYPYVAADVNKSNIAVGFISIEVLTKDKVRTVALFGDSITHMSYYSDALSELCFKEYPGQITFLNLGIGGNRILHDASHMEGMPGEGRCFGIAAMERFEDDVYGLTKPEVVVFLEGVNDMMHPYQFNHLDEAVTKEMLQEGVESLIACAHNHGSKVYLGTVMPFRNDEMDWLPESEKVRVEYNAWVREQKVADDVIDFDQIIRDENKQEYMREGTHIGDGLHPNTEGGYEMAKGVLERICR